MVLKSRALLAAAEAVADNLQHLALCLSEHSRNLQQKAQLLHTCRTQERLQSPEALLLEIRPRIQPSASQQEEQLASRIRPAAGLPPSWGLQEERRHPWRPSRLAPWRQTVQRLAAQMAAV